MSCACLFSLRSAPLRGSRVTLAIFLGGLVLCLVTPGRATVHPDDETARRFGFALEREIAADGGDALVRHFDSAGMRNRTYAPFGEDISNDPHLIESWDKQVLPRMADELRFTGNRNTFICSRPMLREGSRWLECLVLGHRNDFRLLYLRLNESPEGIVAIDDLRYLGAPLDQSTYQRQLLILAGLRGGSGLSHDELMLCDQADRLAGALQLLLGAINRHDVDYAAKQLLLLPDDFRQTPVWHQLFFQLLGLGSTVALDALAAEVGAGQPCDPYLRAVYLSRNLKPDEALALWDQVIDETYGCPYYRVVKAGLLCEYNRSAEALALAQDVSALNPFSGSAYYTIARAASAQGNFPLAVQTLQLWAKVMTRANVERQVGHAPEFAALRASPAYAEWLKSAPAEQVTPSSPASSH